MKRMLVLIVAFMLLLPNTVMAHSKLMSSIPAADSTVDTVPGQIEMIFSTEIESISNFKLYNAAGEQVETGKTAVSGDTMTGSLPPDLANGVYTVKWTIIGADSHSIEGEFSFTLNAPEVAPSPDNGKNEESPEPSITPSPSPTADAEQAAETEQENSGKGSSLTPVLIIGGIIVAAAILISLLRRRKS